MICCFCKIIFSLAGVHCPLSADIPHPMYRYKCHFVMRTTDPLACKMNKQLFTTILSKFNFDRL